jgi:AraC-like DNA-binding protein
VTRSAQMRVASRLAVPVLAYARGRALDEAALLRAAGLEGVAFEPWGQTIAVPQLAALWQALQASVEEPALGLAVAEAVRLEHIDLIHFLGTTSGDLGAALRLFCEGFRVLDSHGTCTLALADARATLQLRHSLREPAFVECFVATTLRGLQSICPRPWQAARIYFTHCPRGSGAEHERFFRCPVEFAAAVDAISLDAALLERETSSPDAILHGLLRRQLDGLVAHADAGSLLQQVRSTITDQLEGGAMTIDTVAAALALSRRTLQRRLDEEGASFSDLVAVVRRGLAELYLRESSLSIAEIAARLGYADPRAFQRAFREWHGTTPSEWRSRTSIE